MKEGETGIVDTRGSKSERLMLDRVIGSQPELGPAPPDGGYGWVILFGSALIQITIPSIIITSGLLICHMLDGSVSLTPDNTKWIWLPTVLYASWSIADPWSISMTPVLNSCCMASGGILVVSAGLLAASLIPSTKDVIYIATGMLAGIGASLTTTQSEFLLQKYFRSRLPVVHTICRISRSIGEILMPILIGTLLNQFGLSSTLLLQTGITLQALVGAFLFRKPKYIQPKHYKVQYSLLKNEEANNRRNSIDTKSDILDTEESSETIPQNFTDTSDDEPNTTYVFPPNSSQQQHPEENVPQPLFSEVDLNDSNQNMTVFIEDSEDDVVLFVQSGGYTSRTIPFTQELRVLLHPTFYSGLILITITKISTLAFWIFLPLILATRLHDLMLQEAIVLLSIGGLASSISVIVCHWLPELSARTRKIFCVASAYVAAGGLYVLGNSYSWVGMVSATVMVRLGTGGVINTFQLVLTDALGSSEVIKTQALLHISSGLLIVLGMMVVSSNFETSFKILAWINTAAGSLWCLQSVFNRKCCSKR